LNTRFFVCDLVSLQLLRAGILNVWPVLMIGVVEQNFIQASSIKDFAAF